MALTIPDELQEGLDTAQNYIDFLESIGGHEDEIQEVKRLIAEAIATMRQNRR